jgi:hypothetical protein
MKVHQITRARTLSVALAAIGLLVAVAVPASSAGNEFKTRVELTRVVQKADGSYRVKGRIHSPYERCRKSKIHPVSVSLREVGVGAGGVARTYGTDWWDRASTRRGKFSIRVPQSEEGSTFRVKGGLGRDDSVDYRCQKDLSRRFTLGPRS